MKTTRSMVPTNATNVKVTLVVYRFPYCFFILNSNFKTNRTVQHLLYYSTLQIRFKIEVQSPHLPHLRLPLPPNFDNSNFKVPIYNSQNPNTFKTVSIYQAFSTRTFLSPSIPPCLERINFPTVVSFLFHHPPTINTRYRSSTYSHPITPACNSVIHPTFLPNVTAYLPSLPRILYNLGHLPTFTLTASSKQPSTTKNQEEKIFIVKKNKKKKRKRERK